jgi:hypothetical protein
VVKSKGKPDAGNPPVRFDEGEGDVSLPTLLGWFLQRIKKGTKDKKQGMRAR